MSNTDTITVPHLGTSTIGYKLGKAYDASLPTLVLVNSFTTSVEQYRPQFADEELSATANLLAIEPYGHGETRASYAQFTYQHNYTGDLGRRHVRISSINLRDRDGLHGRLDDVRCPVLRMHGTEDPVYSVANAEDEMGRFVNSPGAELRVVEGGQHFLSASNPEDVNPATVEFINRWK
jgi:fermentation-respiration switch protein FrsA (DUF1100 family)